MPSAKSGKAGKLLTPLLPLVAHLAATAKSGAATKATAKAATTTAGSYSHTNVSPMAPVAPEAPAGGSAGSGSAGGGQPPPSDPKATCVLVDLSFTCEHHDRKCSDEHELWLVPDTAAGDTLTMKPTVQNGSDACITYVLADDAQTTHKKLSGTKIKVPGYTLPTVTSLVDVYRLISYTPRGWTLEAKGKSGNAAGRLQVYPPNKLEWSAGTEHWKKEFERFTGPLCDQVKQWTGKELDFTKSQNIGGPFFIKVKEPVIKVHAEAQWKECDAKQPTDAWKAYCSWAAGIKADPFFGLELKADLLETAAIVLPGIGPGVMKLYELIRKYLTDEEPPFFASLTGTVEGKLDVTRQRYDRPTTAGEISGKLEFKVGLDLHKSVVSTSLTAQTAIKLTASLEIATGSEVAMIKGSFGWEGVTGKVTVELAIGKQIKFEASNEWKLIEGGDRDLIRISLLPTD